jgi:sulfur dioxygenase
MHADHITGTGVLKNLLLGSKSVIASTSSALADIHVNHHDTVEFGRHKLQVRETPGHTNGTSNYQVLASASSSFFFYF